MPRKQVACDRLELGQAHAPARASTPGRAARVGLDGAQSGGPAYCYFFSFFFFLLVFLLGFWTWVLDEYGSTPNKKSIVHI